MLYRRNTWETGDFVVVQNLRKTNIHVQRIQEEINEILIEGNVTLEQIHSRAKELIAELLPRWRNPFNVFWGDNYINITYNYKDLIKIIRK